MRVDVMQPYGFTPPLRHAGSYATSHHQQRMADIKSAILEGHLIALCGVIGSGKTVTLRRLQPQRKDENRVLVCQVTGGRKTSDHPGHPHHRALL